MVQRERRGFFATLRGLFGDSEPLPAPPQAPPQCAGAGAPLPAVPPMRAPAPAGQQLSVAPPPPSAAPEPPAATPPLAAPAIQWPRPQAAPSRVPPAVEATYRQRDGLLTPAEGAFFRALRAGVGGRWHIVTKVRLADLVAPLPGREWQAAWNRIAAKHVDFALCEPDTLRPRLVIELDDRSHHRPDRVERDAFVDRVFAGASLPILRLPVRRSYDPQGLAGQIAASLAAPSGPTARVPAGRSAGTREEAAPRPCPRCGGELMRRTAKRGQHIGGTFWGCANYPRCRYMASIEA